jgi:hypothetical protein
VLSALEVSDFEAKRDELFANPVARGFMDARELMHQLHHKINAHVSKTFELGRVPTAADFEAECCGGHGGGCCGGENHDHDHDDDHKHGHGQGGGCGCGH